jgi:hypothetical protein
MTSFARVNLVWSLAVLGLLAGCSPGVQGPAATLEHHAGFEGLWLRNGQVEAFVSTRPMVRVVAYRPVGGESVLKINEIIEYSGVRTQFLEPRQNPLSALPASRPGRVVQHSPRRVRVLAEPSAEAGLRAGMDVTLAETGSALTIRHTLENTGSEPREIAPWAIVALPRRGRAVIPFSRIAPADAPPRPFRSIIFVPKRNPRDKTFVIDQFALGVKFQPRGKSTKIGVRTEAGWAAWVDGATVLTLEADFQPRGIYPEGGANVTCYVSAGDGESAWGELEHDGTLETIAPGQQVRLVQTLRLKTLNSPLPEAPDEAMTRIVEEVLPYAR